MALTKRSSSTRGSAHNHALLVHTLTRMHAHTFTNTCKHPHAHTPAKQSTQLAHSMCTTSTESQDNNMNHVTQCHRVTQRHQAAMRHTRDQEEVTSHGNLHTVTVCVHTPVYIHKTETLQQHKIPHPLPNCYLHTLYIRI